jgi:hypothetical protein
VNGADPFAGTDLPSGTVLQNADVIRAPLAGCSALEQLTARASRRASLPKNIGRAWTPEEQERLIEAFKRSESLEQIAANHGRTLRAIEARLELVGMITEQERKTKDRFGTDQSESPHGVGRRKGRPRKVVAS